MASIEKQSNDRWRVRYRTPEGRQRSKTFVRKVDATHFMTATEHSKLIGSYVDASAGRITFKSYAERWRSSQVHRPGTASQVESHLRLHMYPRIGDRPIGAIRRSEIQSLVKSLSTGEGEDRPALAPNTVQTIYAWLATIFRSAVEDRLITHSPCQKINLPEVEESRVVPLPVTTVEALADAVPDRYRALIVLGAGTGIRISEALGLTLDRVDFLKKTVTIDRQLLRVGGAEPRFGPVKDRKNRPRTIPLPAVVVDELAAHLSKWPVGLNGLVFTNKLGTPIRRTTFSDIWRAAAGPLGIATGDGFHVLRHFYASLLIRYGESVKIVQERLGHASAQITLDTYAHLWPDSEDSTRAAVDAVLGKSDVSDSCHEQGSVT